PPPPPSAQPRSATTATGRQKKHQDLFLSFQHPSSQKDKKTKESLCLPLSPLCRSGYAVVFERPSEVGDQSHRAHKGAPRLVSVLSGLEEPERQENEKSSYAYLYALCASVVTPSSSSAHLRSATRVTGRTKRNRDLF